MDEWTRRRAGNFGKVADAYDRGRPEYPDDAVRWLTGADVAPPRVTRPLIVDLGAGTGKLTFAMARHGHRVLAVDSSAGMLEQLVAHRDQEAATPSSWPAAVRASAESLPIAGSSVDAVVVAQAFHWFDHDKVLPQIAQTLRPGGVLGIVWNQRDESVPWVRRLSKILDSESKDFDPTSVLEESGLFQSVERRRFRIWQQLDGDGLVDLVESRSSVASRPRHERQEIIKQVRDLYKESARSTEGLVLPYRTQCYRATAIHQYPRRADADNLFWG